MMKKVIALVLCVGLMLAALPVLAEEAASTVVTTQTQTVETAAAEAEEAVEEAAEAVAEEEEAAEEPAVVPAPVEGTAAALEDAQKLDAAYTLALNAINAEDYETAKEYLNICFVYCNPQTNPVMYADLLLKRACIDVIEEKYDMALLNLDAALRIQPDLADAYLVLTQIYSAQGDVDRAIANLEKYIELTGDASLYETVAQLHEANGDIEAAQAAYDKYVEAAGVGSEEAGFQAALYKMQAGQMEEAIAGFEAYVDDETFGAAALYNIGICRMSLGEFEAAIESFDAAEAKGGLYDGLHYNRGVCRMMQEGWEAAAEDFTASIETESYAADARFNLGLCQMQTGLYEEAVANFTILIGDGDAGADAEIVAADVVYYYRAVCNAALGNLEAALADYTICIEHGYELAQCYYQRAQVYAALGDTENQNSDLANSLKVVE